MSQWRQLARAFVGNVASKEWVFAFGVFLVVGLCLGLGLISSLLLAFAITGGLAFLVLLMIHVFGRRNGMIMTEDELRERLFGDGDNETRRWRIEVG